MTIGNGQVEIARPLWHFSPLRNWMNDPNGLVYFRGLWHMFFQYNPEGIEWGNMSWGHATSVDLLTWVEHDVAIRYEPDEHIFSGSIVVDDQRDQVVAYFTSAYGSGRQAQSRAVSSDGNSWELDRRNPIVDRDSNAFRDPKVIRFHGENGTHPWIMVAVEAELRQVVFYGSHDLEHWEYLSVFGPVGATGVVWECPDLLRMPVDGNASDERWVLLLSTNGFGESPEPGGSSMHYLVGRFNGTEFVPDEATLQRLDYGTDFYAGVTFDSAPGGEQIMIGWMSNWLYADRVPTFPWRGAMSLPRTLRLRERDGELRLHQQLPEFVHAALEQGSVHEIQSVAAGQALSISAHAVLQFAWDPSGTGEVSLRLEDTQDTWVELVHDPVAGVVSVSRGGAAGEAIHAEFASSSSASVAALSRNQLTVILDSHLLEVFVGEGERTFSYIVPFASSTLTLSTHSQHSARLTATVATLSERYEQ